MGCTHYWKSNEFTPKEWDAITKGAVRIVDWCQANGIPLRHEYDTSLMPTINMEQIRFNGAGYDGHETLLIGRGGTEFEFCKTARKPYDTAVTCLLLLIKSISPQFELSSDGDWEEWEDGRKLFESLFDAQPPKFK